MPRIALLLAVALSPAFAETVVLKDGRTLEGEILSETDDTIQLKLRSGRITLRRADIQSVDRAKKESPAAPEDPVAARFASSGNAAVDEARTASLALFRAFEAASKAAGKDADAARAELDPVQRRFDAIESRRKALQTRLDGLYDKYLASLRACGG